MSAIAQEAKICPFWRFYPVSCCTKACRKHHSRLSNFSKLEKQSSRKCERIPAVYILGPLTIYPSIREDNMDRAINRRESDSPPTSQRRTSCHGNLERILCQAVRRKVSTRACHRIRNLSAAHARYTISCVGSWCTRKTVG